MTADRKFLMTQYPFIYAHVKTDLREMADDPTETSGNNATADAALKLIEELEAKLDGMRLNSYHQADDKTLRPIRDRALNDLAKVIRASWGDRCDRFEAGCTSCMAWAVFDLMEKVTEGSSLDDPQELERIKGRYSD